MSATDWKHRNRGLTRTVTLAAVVAAALLFGACKTAKKYPESWHDDEISTGSERVLWEVTVMSFEKHGFPTGTGMDPSTRVAVSGWHYDLQPFRGQGWRERAHVLFEPLEGDRYRVRVRVERELNMDVVRPLDISYAKWKQAPDDDTEARLLMLRIKSWIGGQPMTPDEREGEAEVPELPDGVR